MLKKPLITKASLSNCAKNLLVLSVTIIFIAAILEISLRIYNPLGFRIRGDKIILPRNRKEIIRYDKSIRKLDSIVVCNRNSLGFRGEEPPKDFADLLTIVVVGGSTTECLELSDDKTWPALLGNKLKQNFNRLWLNNAGLGGHSTFGHLVLMKDYVLKLHPKIALFFIGINDVGADNPLECDTRLKQMNFRSMERFLDSMAQYSELFSAAVNMYRYFFPKAVMARAYNDMGEKNFKTLPKLEISEPDRLAVKQKHRLNYVNFYEKRLRALVSICRSNNIEPVFLTQPILYGNVVDEDTGVNLARIKVTEDMDGEAAWEVLELYNDATRLVGQQEGVLVIDIAKELPKNSAYFTDMIHFSNKGAARLAAIAYAKLEPYLATRYRNYLTPPSAGAQAIN
jgi:lysophospholipase L1-like esterase